MIRSAAIASASLALLLASAAASAQTATVEASTQAQTPDMVVTGQTDQDDRDLRSRTCIRSTGSRIVAARNERAAKEGKPQRCVASSGKVYTRRDLDSTGHVDIADALRSLDTSMR
jgi:hypothetical protein